MKIEILDKTKKKKFLNELSYLGLDEKLPYLLIKTGQDRIRAFSGSLSNEEIMEIWRLFPIEGIGLYFGRQILDKRTGKIEARASLDALHLLKSQIKDNILKLNKEQEENWFKGRNIELTNEQQEKYQNLNEYVAVLSSDEKDFIGTGKLSQDKKIIFNFLPKERRVRN